MLLINVVTKVCNTSLVKPTIPKLFRILLTASPLIIPTIMLAPVDIIFKVSLILSPNNKISKNFHNIVSSCKKYITNSCC